MNEKLSIRLRKIANFLRQSYVKECPDYKGEGWCVYPHHKGTPVGPGTGWPKKPSPPATKERAHQLAQTLTTHGLSGGYKKKKKSNPEFPGMEFPPGVVEPPEENEEVFLPPQEDILG